MGLTNYSLRVLGIGERRLSFLPITLTAARVNQNMTQAEAAKALKISLASLQNYEAGRRFPNVEVIKRIEDVYGVEYKELIFLH